jgi:hypothetical protein
LEDPLAPKRVITMLPNAVVTELLSWLGMMKGSPLGPWPQGRDWPLTVNIAAKELVARAPAEPLAKVDRHMAKTAAQRYGHAWCWLSEGVIATHVVRVALTLR